MHKKAFDSTNLLFIFHMLEKFGFGKNFIKLIKTALTKLESCTIREEKHSSILS